MKIKKQKLAAISELVSSLIEAYELEAVSLASITSDEDKTDEAIESAKERAEQCRKLSNHLFDGMEFDKSDTSQYLEDLRKISCTVSELAGKYLDSVEECYSVCSLDDANLEKINVEVYTALKDVKLAIVDLTVAIADIVDLEG